MAELNKDETIALIAYGAASGGQWRLQSVIPRELKSDEVLVRIAASGICLADLHSSDVDAGKINAPSTYFPRVLGHEGAGHIEKVGSSVKNLQPSDAVILSFNYCGHCYNCAAGEAGYCADFSRYNFEGEVGVYASNDEQHMQIGGLFFGQSSFASKAIVKENCVVKVADTNFSYEKLCLLAPLGCGIQTGTGAMINAAAIKPGQSVAIIGVGGVGQSAIMVCEKPHTKSV